MFLFKRPGSLISAKLDIVPPPGLPTEAGSRSEVLDAAGVAHAVDSLERRQGLPAQVGPGVSRNLVAQPRHPRAGVPRGGGAQQER